METSPQQSDLMSMLLIKHSLISLSRCPSPLSDERKEASRPKKKFLAADVRRMHDILSNNMYKIREKVSSTEDIYSDATGIDTLHSCKGEIYKTNMCIVIHNKAK